MFHEGFSSMELQILLIYLLTPWSRVLFEKLIGSQVVKTLPAFYGNLRFITAFTSARHLSLSWARAMQSIPPHPTCWRPVLILSSHLRLGLPSGLFPSGVSNKASPLPHTYYMPRPSHYSRFDHLGITELL